jgi:thiol-disulfide isomerase/thioredoxin
MTGTALLLARVVLAAVLGTAGIAKLADRRGSREAMLGFGVPERFAGVLGLNLPTIELIIATALLPASTARPAGVAAGCLLLLFLAVVVYQLAKGRHPDCHCFGQLHSRPIGRATIVRNVALLLLAIAVTAYPAPSWSGIPIPAISGLEAIALAGIALTLAMIAAQSWMLLNLARQQGRLLLRLDAMEARAQGGVAPSIQPSKLPLGLRVGTQAPPFELPSLDGPPVSLDELRGAGRPVLLVSADPGCRPCASLLPEVAGWQREYAETLTVAVLTRGTVEANRRKLGSIGIARVLLQKQQEVVEVYHTTATPSAVLVNADGKIAAPVAAGPDEIRRLLERAVKPPELRGEGHPIGSPAPPIRLPDLNGAAFDLEDRAGQPTVLLFWNPGCGFCRRMVPDLKAWEAGRPPDNGLVLVSSGTASANRDMGLSSAVLLEEDFAVGRSYGASGTPSAVLIDEYGLVASALMVGASGVLALLERLEPNQALIESA